jgi:hypothetical protein
MCKEDKELLLILSVFMLLSCIVGALQAEDQGPWYLISEMELQNIEQYKLKSEKEKQTWLLQARGLSTRAERLEMESGNLNHQLAEAREKNRNLEKSFSEYEAAQLTTISSKNGEIADWKKKAADQELRATEAEGTAKLRLIIIIALGSGIFIYAAVKIYTKFRSKRLGLIKI